MMARANLGDLLGKVEDAAPPAAPAAATAAAPASEPLPEVPELAQSSMPIERPEQPRATRRDKGSASGTPESTTYLRFMRKETRLREDQQNLLTLHARRLNRAKQASSPRITDNTLIRVAVDLLLARIDDAQGNDEAGIFESLNR